MRSPLGNFRQFFSISNHKANTTELQPKVRKTCLFIKCIKGCKKKNKKVGVLFVFENMGVKTIIFFSL